MNLEEQTFLLASLGQMLLQMNKIISLLEIIATNASQER